MRYILAVLLLGLAHAASAQNSFPSPGNATVFGYLQMCLNPAGNAVPCGVGQITASATGTTAATTATLSGSLGKTTFLCGFDIGAVATAASAGNAQVTGTISGTLNFEQGTGASPAVARTTENFNPCLPASAQNASIAVVSAAPGTGGVISVTAWGYQQ